MEHPENFSLLDHIEEALSGETIVISDLVYFCKDLTELSNLYMKAYSKGVILKSVAQPWLDMYSKGENPVITLLKLVQLNNQILKYQKLKIE